MNSATETAPEEIFEQIRVRLLDYVSCRGMHEAADDIAQETLMVLWKRYSHLKTEGDLVPLAFQICKLKIFEARRSVNKAGRQLNEDLPIADTKTNIQRSLEEKELQQQLKIAVSKMTGRCKTLFRLRLEQRSTAEIARSMGVPETTIYVWEHRCRKGLFEKLV